MRFTGIGNRLAAPFRWLGKRGAKSLKGIGNGLVASLRWIARWTAKGLRSLKSARVLLSIVGLAAAFAVGILVSQIWWSDSADDAPATSSGGSAEADSSTPPDEPETGDESSSSASGDLSENPESTSGTSESNQESTADNPSDDADLDPAFPDPSPTPVVVVLDRTPPTYEEALAVAAALAPLTTPPSDCVSPLSNPDLMPNAPRAYRSGIHQGVDFQCFSLGHSAVAALDGRVVLAVGNYQDPDSDDRDELLGIAERLQATPPFTLLTLYGNFVVIDHGDFPFLGHVVTVYAHLHNVDPDIRVGQKIQAGQRVGEIGNRGTHAAANGDFYTDPHLHWEIHIDNLYLGAGLSTAETREVYTTLFSETLG